MLIRPLVGFDIEFINACFCLFVCFFPIRGSFYCSRISGYSFISASKAYI